MEIILAKLKLRLERNTDKENLGNYSAFCPKFSNGQFGKMAAQSTKLSIILILLIMQTLLLFVKLMLL